jgi:arsenite methyltransferase
MLRDAGFQQIKIAPKDFWRSFIREWLLGSRIDDNLISATIEAVKPRTASHQSLLEIGAEQ